MASHYAANILSDSLHCSSKLTTNSEIESKQKRAYVFAFYVDCFGVISARVFVCAFRKFFFNTVRTRARSSIPYISHPVCISQFL